MKSIDVVRLEIVQAMSLMTHVSAEVLACFGHETQAWVTSPSLINIMLNLRSFLGTNCVSSKLFAGKACDGPLIMERLLIRRRKTTVYRPSHSAVAMPPNSHAPKQP